MSWVYILELRNGKYYIGSTANIAERIKKHQLGKSNFTAKFLPLKLVFKQKFKTYKLAREVETWLKQQKDRKLIEEIINEGIIKKFAKIS